MEAQTRPSVMGFSTMYFRSGKRFDRASLVEGFKQIKDRGVRYEDLFPGSYDPKARVEEILEDKTDAEVIFNGVGTVWTGIKLCPDKELALAVDEFIGQQEIVLKSMSAFTGRLAGISGGTIMADGTVGLVVDIGAVLDRITRTGRAA